MSRRRVGVAAGSGQVDANCSRVDVHPVPNRLEHRARKRGNSSRPEHVDRRNAGQPPRELVTSFGGSFHACVFPLRVRDHDEGQGALAGEHEIGDKTSRVTLNDRLVTAEGEIAAIRRLVDQECRDETGRRGEPWSGRVVLRPPLEIDPCPRSGVIPNCRRRRLDLHTVLAVALEHLDPRYRTRGVGTRPDARFNVVASERPALGQLEIVVSKLPSEPVTDMDGQPLDERAIGVGDLQDRPVDECHGRVTLGEGRQSGQLPGSRPLQAAPRLVGIFNPAQSPGDSRLLPRRPA